LIHSLPKTSYIRELKNNTMAGKLIILFGIDGSGKSSIIKKLKDDSKNNELIFARAITEPLFSKEINLLCEKLSISRKDYITEGLRCTLWTNNLVWNVLNNIVPLLNEGNDVILDRYIICNQVFLETYTDHIYHCMVKTLDCLPIPSLGIFLDVDVDKAISRIANRSYLEQHENRQTLIYFREKYLSIIPDEKYKIDIIDANQDINKVYSDVLLSLRKVIDI